MKRLGALVAVLVLVASCGSSNNGGNNNGPVGSVAGNSLTINDAIYALDTSQNFLFLLASDRTGLCALFTDSNPPTGKSTVLIGGFVNFDGQSVIAPVAGTYNWVSTQNPPTAAGKYVFSQFLVANGCTATTQVDATGGTVTLGAVGANTSGSHTTGSFSLKFGADSLAGSVDATYCAALLANNQNPVACP